MSELIVRLVQGATFLRKQAEQSIKPFEGGALEPDKGHTDTPSRTTSFVFDGELKDVFRSFNYDQIPFPSDGKVIVGNVFPLGSMRADGLALKELDGYIYPTAHESR